MIDTDRYEGHTPAPWNLTPEGHIVADDMTVICNKHTKRIVETNHKDKHLIADAPLLLAEVKRLYREPRMTIDEWNTKPEGPCVTVYMNGCEYIGCLRLYKNEDGEVIE